MASQTDNSIIRSFKAASMAISVAVMFVGCLVLVGWAIDIAAIKSILPAWVTMKANTALAFALAGASLLVSKSDSRPCRASRALAAMVASIGLLNLAQYFSGLDFGIDQLLFKDLTGAVGTSSPGRMSPLTALNMLFSGAALLSIDVETRRGRRPAQFFAIAIALVSFLAIAGYLYGVADLYGIGVYTQMAFHTALTFLFLSAGIMMARPDRGLMTAVTNHGSGGLTARRLLLAAALVPLLLGWLRLEGERAGFFGKEFGVALMITAVAVILTTLIWWTSESVFREETRRRLAQEALRRSEAKFKSLFEGSPDAIIVVDSEGVIRSVNLQAEKLFGYSRDQLLDQHIEKLLPARLRHRHAAIHSSYLADPQTRLMNGGSDLSGLRSDGMEFPVNVMLSPLGTEDGTMVLSVIRDTTELNRALEELARSNRELDQFAHIASHDLQEPLRSIQLFSERLIKSYSYVFDERGRDYLDRTYQSAQRMQQLIRGMLAYSRVSEAKTFEQVDLNRTAQEAIDDLHSHIERTGTQIELSGLPVIEADPLQMRQLMQNLISNAIKFRAKGRPPVIKIRGDGSNGHCRLMIEDNGIGFDEKYLDRIFAPFQRLHGRSEYEGTGIGLALCRKIALRHGGDITARSTPNEGATFIVTLNFKHSGAEGHK
jgi:two-component system sensor kinase FixL